MKRPIHPSRELVLRAIRRNPEITVHRIANMTGLTINAVRGQISNLESDDIIHSVKLAQNSGRLRTSMNGYHFGPSPEPTGVQNEPAPKHWDVLAHFFGLNAEPAAA